MIFSKDSHEIVVGLLWDPSETVVTFLRDPDGILRELVAPT